jgi:DNA modification methylase
MNKIEFGDCRDIMRRWASEGVKVQTCVTSPPYYGLRSYLKDDDPSKKNEVGLELSPEEYINNMVEVFRCVRDILNDDGTVWINIGDSYYNYRPGDGGYAKQTINNSRQDLPTSCAKRSIKMDGLKNKDLIGIPWLLAFALRNDGWYLRQEIIWEKLTPMPESVTDRCTKSHEQIFLLSKNPNYYFDYESIMEDAASKPSKKPMKIGGNKYSMHGDNNNPDVTSSNHTGFWDGSSGKRRKRSVWTMGPEPYSGNHYAAFPTELPRICIKAGSRVGDIVLDPFMGSATTAQVALENNRQYLGCELNTEYANLQQDRINNQLSKKSIVIENDGTFGNGLFKV